jgi:hypothetical protein
VTPQSFARHSRRGVDGSLVVGFTPDGKFAIDNDGSLDDGNFASGT